MSTLGDRLKHVRLKAGLSQERLGLLAGLDEATASTRMNQYELGVHVPKLPLVKRLAAVLKVPVPYFYADEDRVAELLLAFDPLPLKLQEDVVQDVKGLVGSRSKD